MVGKDVLPCILSLGILAKAQPNIVIEFQHVKVKALIILPLCHTITQLLAIL